MAIILNLWETHFIWSLFPLHSHEIKFESDHYVSSHSVIMLETCTLGNMKAPCFLTKFVN